MKWQTDPNEQDTGIIESGQVGPLHLKVWDQDTGIWYWSIFTGKDDVIANGTASHPFTAMRDAEIATLRILQDMLTQLFERV